ncbi:MAG: aminomethyl-transferring glycine dehydrogenase subunit GcvPA [Nitrospinae bacterium]|nr:aminomethyl-transferring glycine dehydrogenase subunit GcvPA [Nitrospinota bacterium]
MRYIPHTEQDIKEMLARIGVKSIGEVFDSIPKALRLEKPLDLPAPLAESELLSLMKRMGAHNPNPDEYAQFQGAGAYRHFIPALVNHLASRGEFSTCYTPYQPEVSQGTLQAIFEFQSMICMLTGMEVANASMYDGASALAEAVLMAARVAGREEILVSRAVHPEYRQTARTYVQGNGVRLVEVPFGADGRTDVDFILDNLGERTAAVAIQSPNFFGAVEPYSGLAERLRERGVLLIVVVAEALSLGILKSPGERGADIVVGEGQSLGLPVSYGGPYLGFFAVREKQFRQMPGRLVGETVDTHGNRAFVLTLSAREQHIRREKATSNICTNEGLCALIATIYLAAMGKQGLRETAVQNLRKADYLKNKLAKLKNHAIRFSGETFNEFVLDCPIPAQTVQEKLLRDKIVAGVPLARFYPEMPNSLLLCVTETNTADEMDRLAEKLADLA